MAPLKWEHETGSFPATVYRSCSALPIIIVTIIIISTCRGSSQHYQTSYRHPQADLVCFSDPTSKHGCIFIHPQDNGAGRRWACALAKNKATVSSELSSPLRALLLLSSATRVWNNVQAKTTAHLPRVHLYYLRNGMGGRRRCHCHVALGWFPCTLLQAVANLQSSRRACTVHVV